MILTDTQKENYERDGFLIYGPILSEEGLEALRSRIDALAEGSHPNADKIRIRLEAAAQRGELENVPRRDKVWQLMDPHRYDEVIFNHASSPKILDIVEELLHTEDIKLFHTQTLMKPAFHGSIVSWHQDSAYWTSIEPPTLVSCWIALDDATEENGCVRLLPGSYKKGIWPHERRDFLHAQGVDTSQAVPVVLKSGGCSFHHSLTVHGSGENRTPHRRRGLVTSYMRADSKFIGDADQKPDFPLLRGREYPGCV
ncbi:MAG: phytanoyl-CoA dioxygenase family protein [Candidatus Poribacteria bacterium]|nr:phytanoyl-CoA dioxygenase family protein [Candidatus Poribacteria bacterium]